MGTDALKRGVTRSSGEQAQLNKVAGESLSDLSLIGIHEDRPVAPHDRQILASGVCCPSSGILRLLPSFCHDSSGSSGRKRRFPLEKLFGRVLAPDDHNGSGTEPE